MVRSNVLDVLLQESIVHGYPPIPATGETAGENRYGTHVCIFKRMSVPPVLGRACLSMVCSSPRATSSGSNCAGRPSKSYEL